MTRDRYEVAPIFGVRPAGVPFDVLERLGTPGVTEAARRLIALEAQAGAAADEALGRLRADVPDRTLQQFLKRKLMRRIEIPPERMQPWLEPCDRAIRAARAAATELEALLWREYERVQDDLLREAARELPDFLTIESEVVADEIERVTEASLASPPGHGNAERRKLDRTLALYLQRVCAKNDSVSRFGPIAWGKVVPGDGVWIRPIAGVANRLVDIERWVVIGLIEKMNADPDVRPEALPRLHWHGRFEGTGFHRLDEEREIPLSPEERAVAERCDGLTPAHRLDLDVVAQLAERGVIRWAIEPMARDVAPLASLRSDVAAWRAGPLRDRWLGRIDALAAFATAFAADPSATARRKVLTELQALLEELGITRPENRRTLYAARNPIIENCFQAGEIALGANAVGAMVSEAWPWFEMFRDAVAYTSARVFQRMHELVVAAPRRDGKLSYSTLARVARQRGPGIEDDTLAAMVGGEVWADIKRELAEELADRADAPTWQLTAHDCGFLRRRHRFPDSELGFPSADLQVTADSVADAEAGRVGWIIAELHGLPVLLQNSSYWCCPDKPALHASLARAFQHRPFLARDSGNTIPVHVNPEPIMAAAPSPTYVGSARPKPGWPTLRPADAEVIVDEERCDIRLRSPAGTDLGTIIATPRMLVALHPFFPFEREPHAPRLRVGNVIVQRQTWHLESTALGEPRPSGVSAGFVCRLERERAERGIPRWVFVRPAWRALKDRGALTRDKDNKPLFIDLENVVFLDILERRLRKYGSLVVTEMLPAPHELVWRTPEGRFTFEMRTNLVEPSS
jgi:hypothetical protein